MDIKQCLELVNLFVEQNWSHVKRPALVLGNQSMIYIATHLVEEAHEVLAAFVEHEEGHDDEYTQGIDISTHEWGQRKSKEAEDELGDLMGVVLHICIVYDIPLHRLFEICANKLMNVFQPQTEEGYDALDLLGYDTQELRENYRVRTTSRAESHAQRERDRFNRESLLKTRRDS
jgi:NTP pyrophosphatase (non-canonical NTP hydrolase)